MVESDPLSAFDVLVKRTGIDRVFWKDRIDVIRAALTQPRPVDDAPVREEAWEIWEKLHGYLCVGSSGVAMPWGMIMPLMHDLSRALTHPRPVDDAGALRNAVDAAGCLESYRHYLPEENKQLFMSHIATVLSALASQQGKNAKIRRLQKLVAAQREEIAAHDAKDAHIERQAEDIRLKDEALRHANGRIRELVQKATEKNALIEKLRAAVKALQAEPHGCPFCHSGKIINPGKAHDDDCGYRLAEEALRDTAQGEKHE